MAHEGHIELHKSRRHPEVSVLLVGWKGQRQKEKEGELRIGFKRSECNHQFSV